LSATKTDMKLTKRFKALGALIFLLATKPILSAQPFVDVVSVNHQWMKTKTSSDSFTNTFNNSFLAILLPIKVDSNNYFILRMNGELLNSSVSGHGYSEEVKIKMGLFGLGWQHYFNKKFAITAFFLPKIATESDKLSSPDFQFGGTVLAQYKIRKNFRYKAGLYYNREPFGNFFVPLLGADVQLNERNWIYGQLPLYFRYEHKFSEKFYSGLGVRIFGRSYRLGEAHQRDYVFLQENQLKLFCDYYVTPKIVVYGELGRTIGYGLNRYKNNTARDNQLGYPTLYSPIKDGFYINAGLAYRVRQSF
jgi:hypothetical protein